MNKLQLFIPQWQGSGLTKELYEGSHALKKMIEDTMNSTFRSVEIDSERNPVLKNDILGYEAIIEQLLKTQNLLDFESPEKVFSLGGGCGIEVPIVSYLKGKYNELTLFWFDAHGDLNTPQSSPSKHFHGMPLRFLTDESQDLDRININKISPEDLNLVGVRDLDVPERSFIKINRINTISVNSVKEETLFKSMINNHHGKAYIHIDLDVLDPKHYRNVKCPTDCGLTINDLTISIKNIMKNVDLVGFSIVENTELENKEILKLIDIINIGLEF